MYRGLPRVTLPYIAPQGRLLGRNGTCVLGSHVKGEDAAPDAPPAEAEAEAEASPRLASSSLRGATVSNPSPPKGSTPPSHSGISSTVCPLHSRVSGADASYNRRSPLFTCSIVVATSGPSRSLRRISWDSFWQIPQEVVESFVDVDFFLYLIVLALQGMQVSI